MNIDKRFLGLIALCLMLLGGITGCNTVRGVGQDMEAAGEGLSDEAEEKKGY